jgi:hypothetical protein
VGLQPEADDGTGSGKPFGTLWAERFRSLLVEDQPGPVQAVAAYVDLNPVRAEAQDGSPTAARVGGAARSGDAAGSARGCGKVITRRAEPREHLCRVRSSLLAKIGSRLRFVRPSFVGPNPEIARSRRTTESGNDRIP